MANQPRFSTNEEIDALKPGDLNVTLTGFIDCVEGPEVVEDKLLLLLKFVINNGEGKRVRILMWENDVIKYSSLIVHQEIVEVARGNFRPINSKYYREEDGILPYELTFTKISSIKTFGQYKTPKLEVSPSVSTTIENCLNFEENISVEGFIKDNFVETYADLCTFGCGSIIDGRYKLNIRIINFPKNHSFMVGSHVRVQGQVKKDKYDLVYLQVNHIKNIELIDAKVLSDNELKVGIYTPEKKIATSIEAVKIENQPSTSKRRSDDSTIAILKKLCFNTDGEQDNIKIAEIVVKFKMDRNN